jgi:hypothetical protein
MLAPQAAYYSGESEESFYLGYIVAFFFKITMSLSYFMNMSKCKDGGSREAFFSSQNRSHCLSLRHGISFLAWVDRDSSSCLGEKREVGTREEGLDESIHSRCNKHQIQGVQFYLMVCSEFGEVTGMQVCDVAWEDNRQKRCGCEEDGINYEVPRGEEKRAEILAANSAQLNSTVSSTPFAELNSSQLNFGKLQTIRRH